MDNSKCVVLVPMGGHIEPECERALTILESRGFQVRRVSGYSAIDQGRSQMATDALADGFEELLWIDSDIGFDPDSVDRLRSHGLRVVCGIYPKKGQRALACHLLPATREVVFGDGGGLIEIAYAATGFLLTHREVYQKIRAHARLPTCNERFGRCMVPYFLPLLAPDGAGHWCLGEDFAFCERAKASGYKILADTTIRLRHLGRYGYSWEDAGGELPRYSMYTFQVADSRLPQAEANEPACAHEASAHEASAHEASAHEASAHEAARAHEPNDPAGSDRSAEPPGVAAKHARIPYESCPLCGASEATEVRVADCSGHPLYKAPLPKQMHWVRCDLCAHLFVDGYFGRESLELLLGSAHASQTPGHEPLQARAVSAKIVEDVTRLMARPEGRWLDVGFGNGSLLTTAAEFGYDVVGLDLREESVARMRSAGYQAHCVDLAEFAAAEPFAVISLADVLEHMPFPKPALVRAHELLAPGGLLFVSMPNLDAFVWKTLDQQQRNPYWSEIEHLHNFGRARLSALLRECGFEPCRYGISQRYIACMEMVARRA